MTVSDATWILVNKVIVPERRRRNLGDLGPLAKSIKSHGLLDPIIITNKDELVSGWRRLEAHRKLGKPSIQAYVVSDALMAISLIEKEGSNPNFTKPMNWLEKVAFAVLLYELDASRQGARFVMSRVNAGKARHGGKPVQFAKVPNDPGPTSLVMANLFKVSRQTWDRARAVYYGYHEPLDGQPSYRAVKAVELLSKDGKVNTAYNILTGAMDPELAAEKMENVAKNLVDQQAILGNSKSILQGALMGLARIKNIAPEMDQKEATEWADSLSSIRRNLTTLITNLRRHARG